MYHMLHFDGELSRELSRDGSRFCEIAALVCNLLNLAWLTEHAQWEKERGNCTNRCLCAWPKREIQNGTTCVWMQICKNNCTALLAAYRQLVHRFLCKSTPLGALLHIWTLTKVFLEHIPLVRYFPCICNHMYMVYAIMICISDISHIHNYTIMWVMEYCSYNAAMIVSVVPYWSDHIAVDTAKKDWRHDMIMVPVAHTEVIILTLQ